jgi:hypothetical protein
MAHSHGLVSPVPARALRRWLTVGVALFIAATATGVIALWPAHVTRRRAADLGAAVQLINGTVTTVRQGPCAGSPPDVASACTEVGVRLHGGPESGQTTTLEMGQGGDQPNLHRGDRVIVGRSNEPGAGVAYYF